MQDTFDMTGYPVIPNAQVLQKKPITEEEYRFLMKRRAIPSSARDMLDIMLNAVYAKLAPSESQAPGEIEELLAIGKEAPFFSKTNMDLLKESKQQMESGRFITKSWKELEELANR